MLREYFKDPEFTRLYLHRFLFAFGTSAMHIFTGAYFLMHGMPLHFVILFFGLEFGFRGLLCPFSLYLFKKLGLTKALILSASSMILFFILVANAEYSLTVSFFSFILHAFGGSLYYPLSGVIEAIVIKEDSHRGRQYTFSIVADMLAVFLGAGVIAFLIGQYSFLHASVLIAICLVLSIYPIANFSKHIDYQKDYRPKDLYKFFSFT